jgi:hypothetical protein
MSPVLLTAAPAVTADVLASEPTTNPPTLTVELAVGKVTAAPKLDELGTMETIPAVCRVMPRVVSWRLPRIVRSPPGVPEIFLNVNGREAPPRETSSSPESMTVLPFLVSMIMFANQTPSRVPDVTEVFPVMLMPAFSPVARIVVKPVPEGGPINADVDPLEDAVISIAGAKSVNSFVASMTVGMLVAV